MKIFATFSFFTIPVPKIEVKHDTVIVWAFEQIVALIFGFTSYIYTYICICQSQCTGYRKGIYSDVEEERREQSVTFPDQ